VITRSELAASWCLMSSPLLPSNPPQASAFDGVASAITGRKDARRQSAGRPRFRAIVLVS